MMIMIVWIVLLMKGYTEGAAGTKIDSASTSKPRLHLKQMMIMIKMMVIFIIVVINIITNISITTIEGSHIIE